MDNSINNINEETNDLNSIENFNKNDFIRMKKRLKRSRIGNFILLFIIVLMITAISILAYIGIGIYNNVKPHFRALFGDELNLSSISQISKHNAINLENFSKKLAVIDDTINLFYHYDNKDNKKIEDAMFSGYLSALGDKYAEYMPAKDFEDFTEKTTEGVYYGIGCVVSQDKDTKDSIIDNVYEGSPAEKGGILKGDILVNVDGKNVRGENLDYIISLIRGQEGTKREIEVFRESENRNVVLTVYCGKVDIKLVSSKVYEDNIGYISLTEFTGKSSKQFKDSIDKLLKDNINGLIIDLRGNPGGELTTVCEIIDYMVKDRDGRYTLNQKEDIFEIGKTLIVYIRERDKIVDAAYASDGHEVDIPIVILTDFSTASASELFTETLRDYKKATVVGVRTYGKGVVQQILPLADGSAIKFTVSEYFPPSGYSIDKKGIIPDYSLDYDGNEIEYDDEHNIITIDEYTKYFINTEGKIIKQEPIKISSSSEIVSDEKDENHIENLKIYDLDNEFLNEDWYIGLEKKYEDKQLLQAIVVLKNKIK